jgi:serine/threonine-protein kinase HipA
MTLTKHLDSDDSASYLELAEFMATYGQPEYIGHDLEELFTRVVFNVVVANRDDHLRNHGFIRSPAGWRLAPAYDMNPSRKKEEHSLSLDLYGRIPDLDVVISTADFYHLDSRRAREIVEMVCGVVSGWKDRARKIGLSAQECAGVEHLFICAT